LFSILGSGAFFEKHQHWIFTTSLNHFPDFRPIFLKNVTKVSENVTKVVEFDIWVTEL